MNCRTQAHREPSPPREEIVDLSRFSRAYLRGLYIATIVSLLGVITTFGSTDIVCDRSNKDAPPACELVVSRLAFPTHEALEAGPAAVEVKEAIELRLSCGRAPARRGPRVVRARALGSEARSDLGPGAGDAHEGRGKTFETLREGLPQEHAFALVYRHAMDIAEDGDQIAFGSTTGNLWVTGGPGRALARGSAPPAADLRRALRLSRSQAPRAAVTQRRVATTAAHAARPSRRPLRARVAETNCERLAARPEPLVPRQRGEIGRCGKNRPRARNPSRVRSMGGHEDEPLLQVAPRSLRRSRAARRHRVRRIRRWRRRGVIRRAQHDNVPR